MPRLFTVFLCALAVQSSTAGPASAVETSVLGVYTLVEINGHALPARTWDSDAEDADCPEEVVSGTLLVGSSGDWSALFEMRQDCAGDKTPADSDAPRWDLLAGRFETAGDEITFYFMDLPTSGKIPAAGGDLVLHAVGIFKYEGQSLDYVFRRK